MQITGVTKENAKDFCEFLTKDIAEKLDRINTCGIMVQRDEGAPRQRSSGLKAIWSSMMT